jgi:hypothetical protein
MPALEPVAEKSLDIYGAPPIPWTFVRERLAANTAASHWLGTVRPDGRPHVTAVGALWLEDMCYFTAGAGSRKAKNIARNPACVITASIKDVDVVVEGVAAKVTDEATLQRLADLYAAQGWSPQVRDGAFTAEYSAPSAGPPPWDVYRITPQTLFAVGTSDAATSAMRWRF